MDDLIAPLYGGPQTGEQMAKTQQAVTVTGELEIRKTNLERQLSLVNDALTGLKSNPEIERVLNLIQRASRGY